MRGKVHGKVFKKEKENVTAGKFFTKLMSTLTKKDPSLHRVRGKVHGKVFKKEKENVTAGKFFTKLMSTLTKKDQSIENLRVVPD